MCVTVERNSRQGRIKMTKTARNGEYKIEIEDRMPEENELAYLPNGHVYPVEKIIGAIAILDAPRAYRASRRKILRTAIPQFDN